MGEWPEESTQALSKEPGYEAKKEYADFRILLR